MKELETALKTRKTIWERKHPEFYLEEVPEIQDGEVIYKYRVAPKKETVDELHSFYPTEETVGGGMTAPENLRQKWGY
ncbi:MAG: hypothetical protein KAS04_03050 [Candidatus Aenigmarchaeota archaeon]|nr:hypothetical protein [Candidatus Aenigmarchaeota archaeon]